MGNCCGSGLRHFQDQDYNAIKKEVLGSGEQFFDDRFRSPRMPRGREDVVWLRPHQICENLRGRDKELYGTPMMGDKKMNKRSINQGEIGNCWFLSALTGLVENKHFFRKVVPSGQGFHKDYCGLFRFRFYRHGDWFEVVIDDRLPTRNGRLLFLQGGQPNEFWPALFEKAYAKFYGSYANIEGGVSLDAGVDFTGGIPERLNVEDYLRKPGNGPEKLHHLLEVSHKKGALISCTLGGSHAMEAVNQKLQQRHAYTVIGMTKVRGGRNGKLVIPLMRLRDPHGAGIRSEWNGDWGDESQLWNEISARTKTRLLSQENDGEFYVSFHKDFLRYFLDIDIIHLNPIRLELNEYRQTRKFALAEFKGDWRSGVAGATTQAHGFQDYHRNPQYPFSISNCRDKNATCTVVVSLSQKFQEDQKKANIGFTIYKNCSKEPLDAKFVQNAFNVAGKSEAFINSREVSANFLLPAGSYCIIPSTFNRAESGSFLLRLFVDSRWNCEAGDASFSTVRDYKASARASQRCRSLICTLFCCQCYCCCCCCPCSKEQAKEEEYKMAKL